MPTIAVSSWSVRHALGPMYPGLALTQGARTVTNNRFGSGSLTLLDLPAAARAAGIGLLDVCHFHFPRTDADYLRQLSDRMAAAGVQLLTLLVDEGDISTADTAARERDLASMRDWIDIAARLGARYVRVIAGEQDAGPNDDAVQRSAAGLSTLARYAQERSVGLLIENFRPLAMSHDNLLALLDATKGTVGLVADFGNYKGPEKYGVLRAILPRATTIHAHASVEWMRPGATDEGDLQRCLALSRAAGFAGAYVLIFDGDPAEDEWAGIGQMAATVQDYC